MFFSHRLSGLLRVQSSLLVLWAGLVCAPGPLSAQADALSGPSRSEIDAYIQRVKGRIISSFSGFATARQRGIIRLQLTPQGQLKGAALDQSFGDPECDRSLLAHIRQLAPFEPLPASFSAPDISLTLPYLPDAVIEHYLESVRPSVYARLSALGRMTRTGEVELKISGNGTVRVRTLASFGDPQLDRRAVESIKGLSPLPAIPGAADWETVSTTFSYGPAAPIPLQQPTILPTVRRK
ncbi:cell envelope integrity protein TolA [Gloeobacter kilaueensis]|uniref:TonB family protein n=1 Tax=Gloeobacter kilaueensis (strain ATCC BAA-2537 / CCAP 1431/1 / ULC 316 / JS1) TaxID=1183438 RepID=U5QHE7_GLOK1|nr:cell envelope integrity protein TolA [Gloeobacter kilaueensis]AGY58387.1 hypothetical protein GKIL_2141 [Gloeobacter kilaueensis JS1]